MARNETILIEHGLDVSSPARSTYYERRCRTPVREYLVEIRFDPLALPDRVIRYCTLDEVEKYWPAPSTTPCQRSPPPVGGVAGLDRSERR
ncbi:hypothetical protein [Amycolatopsis keratiniphila]|uniref:hypothetical protein n=1 Tax=Amycolatopsis keratiniphila TaxID=129921 RepID=UPI0009077D03|nr:hypothetical protein [Amycolatopsis keratiniphila]